MSTSSDTQTQTYTLVDVKRVLSRFAADLGMIAQVTGLRSREMVAQTVSDLVGFAVARYLVEVHVMLLDKWGRELRALKYVVSGSAGGWQNDRPGANIWPTCSDAQLRVVATLSDKWWELDADAQTDIRSRLGIVGSWSRTTLDTSHAGLTATLDRRYSSNAFGLERTLYS